MIQQLIALLRPWGHPKAVHDASQNIVDDLLTQQKALEERITGRSSEASHLRVRSLVFVMLAGLTAGVSFVLLSNSVDGELIFWSRNSFYSVVNRLYSTSLVEKLLIGMVLSWIAGTFILWSAVRR